MIKLVYDKGNCVGCPPEMGCMGRYCPQCWEHRMYCDVCKEEVDELWRDLDTNVDLCEDCRDSRYAHITIDEADDYITDNCEDFADGNIDR